MENKENEQSQKAEQGRNWVKLGVIWSVNALQLIASVGFLWDVAWRVKFAAPRISHRHLNVQR